MNLLWYIRKNSGMNSFNSAVGFFFYSCNVYRRRKFFTFHPLRMRKGKVERWNRNDFTLKAFEPVQFLTPISENVIRQSSKSKLSIKCRIKPFCFTNETHSKLYYCQPVAFRSMLIKTWNRALVNYILYKTPR